MEMEWNSGIRKKWEVRVVVVHTCVCIVLCCVVLFCGVVRVGYICAD